MKAIYLILGATIIISSGFTYRICSHDVDVRLVKVDSHDYVLATGAGYQCNGPIGVSIVHHVGCKKCHEVK